jgi:hypothetical protein
VATGACGELDRVLYVFVLPREDLRLFLEGVSGDKSCSSLISTFTES